jgi:hypothetical protein
MTVDDQIPVQFFQSIIAVELGVTGALLFQIRFFESRGTADDELLDDLPDARIRLFLALVLGATIFGSLEAIRHEGGEIAASAVTLGLAISLVPILLRVLPPLKRDASTTDRHVGVTIVGLVLYAIVVGIVILMLNV